MTDDRRRYRKVYCRLWIHPIFQALSSDAKVVMLYLLTGPQTNRIGLFGVSLALASEQVNLPTAKVKRCVQVVCETFDWAFDGRVNVLFIPSWWKWNDVRENLKVFKGALSDLNEIPETPLIAKFLAHRSYVPTGFHYLLEGLSDKRAIPELEIKSGTQEQEQEQDLEQEQKQEQEQDSRALTRPDESRDTEFDIFRNAYPANRRVGGEQGRRAFASAMKGRNLSDHLAVMLAALEQHQRSEQWQNPKYIPLMTTWLNQERWTMTLPVAGVMGQSVKTAGNQSAIEQFVARRQGGTS